MRSDMEWLSLVRPFERLGHGAIEVCDESQHLVLEIVSGGEVASPQQLTDQAAQPKLHLIQPGSVGGREVHVEARMPCQPPLHLGGLVVGIVVRNQVDVLRLRRLFVDYTQELEPLLVAVPVVAHADHPYRQPC